MPQPGWGTRRPSGTREGRGRGGERHFGKEVWLVLAMGTAGGVAALVIVWWRFPLALFLPLLLGVCLLLGLVLWWSELRDDAAWQRGLGAWMRARGGGEGG